ncbi:hypothetical protein Tco_1108559 [Tanacetum coccineum]
MTTLITTSTIDGQMHKNIMAAGQPAIDESLEVPERTTVETFMNITPKHKAHYDAKKEAIRFPLTRIGDEIYSTIDACKTAHDIFTLRDGESINSYYSRFYKMMNEIMRNQLEVATMQYQKEVNDICAEKIAKNANSLALVVVAQQYSDTYYQAPKPHRSYAPPAKTSPSTRSYATTRHKDKEIAKPITPLSESTSKEDTDPEQAQKDKEMQKNLALIAKYFKKIYKPTNNNLRTSSNSRNKHVDTNPRYAVRKPKREKDYTYHKEKMLLCKQAKKGVPLQAKQADWLEEIDEEIVKQELEAHYSFMGKIQEVLLVKSGSDAELLEKSALEEFKSSLEISNITRDRYLGALHDKEVELEKYKIFKDHTIEKDTLERKLNETLGLLAQKEHDRKEGLKIKAYEVSVVKEKHNELVKRSLLTKSSYEGLVKEKNKVIKDSKLKEEKVLDTLIAVEKQLKF